MNWYNLAQFLLLLSELHKPEQGTYIQHMNAAKGMSDKHLTQKLKLMSSGPTIIVCCNIQQAV